MFEPIRYILAFFESIVVFFGVLSNSGQITIPGDYFTKLNNMAIFENRAQKSLPQTDIHDIILEHFTENTSGKDPKCLLIGYDGARPDALTFTIDGSENGVRALLNSDGKLYNMYTGGPMLNPFRWQDTSTASGWTTMLTGHWAKESGDTGHKVSSNGMNKPVDPKLIFTQLLEKGLVDQTAFVVSWGGHFTGDGASYKNDIAYCAEKNLNANWITLGSDALVFEQTMIEVQDPNAGMVMCILEYCDHNGHGTGPGTGFYCENPTYEQAIRDSERDAYALIQAVKARPSYDAEDWLIIITTDHGGTFNGHGSQFAGCRQTFLALNKPL